MAHYVSKIKERRYVIRPTDRTMDTMRRVTVIPGKTAQFMNGHCITNDPEVIAFLNNHPAKGVEFYAIDEVEERLLKPQVIPVVVGAKGTGDLADEFRKYEETTHNAQYTPTTTTAISPELIELIDTRITAALDQIKNLISEIKETEAKVKEGKPRKSFKCPYCEEVFPSGFKVGEHKLICAKKS